MKKQKFAILDRESFYAGNLMEYMAERQTVPFETMVFEDLESLERYTAYQSVDLLLVSARMMCPGLRQMNVGKIILLSEGEIGQDSQEYPVVYKYQSSEQIMAEVMDYYADQDQLPTKVLRRGGLKIVGVYGPSGRCGKTGFALTLAQILGQKEPALYLNLEEYSGFGNSAAREKDSDLADVMYFFRQHRGNAVFKLNGALRKMGAVDYVPPAFSPVDLQEIELSEWLHLLEELEEYSQYRTVILDIGGAVREAFALLSQCGRIYTPLPTDAVSERKMQQYECLLREMEYEEVLEKTRKVPLPYCEPAGWDEYLPERLAAGEMGICVRRLLEQEGCL